MENIKRNTFCVYGICLIICNRSNKKSIQFNKKVFHYSICFINHDIPSEFNQIEMLLSHTYNFRYIYNRTCRKKKNCWRSILYVVIANDLYCTDGKKIPRKFNISC